MPESDYQPSPRSRRCFHRVISGLERGGDFRFLTLTSSKDSPDTCQRSFRALHMRLKRRNLVTAYIKCPEPSKNGKQHLHIIFKGSYVDQALVSHWWQQIHRAKIIDIRRIYLGTSKKRVASYMAKYMSKNNLYRYSWSWSWVWRGFVKDWTRLKRLWRHFNSSGEYHDFQQLLTWWRWWLKALWQPPFELLPEPP